MKKIKYLFVLLLLSLVCNSIKAATMTEQDVKNYRASILAYVKNEGYMPKLDSDGDINFKHDGDNYWISVSAYDDGYYVEVYTSTSVSGKSMYNVRKAIDDTARSLKFVKLYSLEDRNVISTYSWYCISILDFKRMFSDALLVVSTADSRFIKNMLSYD